MPVPILQVSCLTYYNALEVVLKLPAAVLNVARIIVAGIIAKHIGLEFGS